VTSADYEEQGIDSPDFARYGANKPALIYSRPVLTELDIAESMKLTADQVPAYAQVLFYEPLTENISEIFKYNIDIDEVVYQNVEMKARLLEVVGEDISKYNYIALNAKYQNMILILDDDGSLIGEVKAPYHG